MRKLKLANAQKRDAEVVFSGIVHKPVVNYFLPNGGVARHVRILKADVDHQYEALKSKIGEAQLVDEMIAGDPEINFHNVGKLVSGGRKILVNATANPIYQATVTECVYNAAGQLEKEKPFVNKNQNVLADAPISWTGKKIPITDAISRFVFSKNYQLTHTNGLTFDFLFAMAKELHEGKVLMMLAAGANGKEPLIFTENGKPYRAFLEGRIQDESYLLILHLTNMELKPIN